MTTQPSRCCRRPFLPLLGLAFGTWLPLTPALAQNAPAAPSPDAPAPLAVPGQPAGDPSLTPSTAPALSSTDDAIAASGSNVYILRGSTLYQLRAADLTEVTHRELPLSMMPGTAGAPPAGDLTAPNAPAAPGGQAAPPPPATPDIAPAAPAAPNAPPAGAEPIAPPAGGMFSAGPGGVRMTATGNYVYLLRGDTLFQVRTTDLSLVGSKRLPMSGMTGPGAAPLPGLNAEPTRRGRAGRNRRLGAPGPGTPAPGGTAPAAPTF